MDDHQLLRQFVAQNSQEAFSALTKRYLGLVYSVCRRELDDAEAAEDVTQAVFLILARKAPTLGRSVVLSGWLFQTARFAAKNARLQAQRRAAYEQKAAEAMDQSNRAENEEAAWAEIEPVLNLSLAALGQGERDCVLLRFFQGLSFAEAGTALGLSEEAARKRVTRALDKMRRFFVKQGVIVPAAALAALLTAHAARAVPLTCQAGVASLTAGTLAGYLNVGLTGSHAYQISEGTLKAMKIIQLKIAAGFTAAAVIGLTSYSVAKPMLLPLTKAHPVALAADASAPGHPLIQTPGKTLTAGQIADNSRHAYAALQSYQGTSTVNSQNTVGSGSAIESHTMASVKFLRPGKISVQGTDSSGSPFAYVSNGVVTEETNVGTPNTWKKSSSAEMAIAAVTGIALYAGTTVPAVLLGTTWGYPFPKNTGIDAEVREDEVDSHPCYVLTAHTAVAASTMTRRFWVDEKTFLLRRSLSDNNIVVQMPANTGQPGPKPVNLHIDERFTDQRLNETIPESTFTLPAAQ